MYIYIYIPTKFGSKLQNEFRKENNDNDRQRGRTPSDCNISHFVQVTCTQLSIHYPIGLHAKIYFIVVQILNLGHLNINHVLL
jgi:hypothetical protein